MLHYFSSVSHCCLPVRQHVAAKLLYTYKDFTKHISDVYFIWRWILILPLSNNILQEIYFEIHAVLIFMHYGCICLRDESSVYAVVML